MEFQLDKDKAKPEHLLQTLLDLGVVDNLHVKNFLIANIKEIAPFAKNIELLVNTNKNVMYIYLNYYWYAFFFRVKNMDLFNITSNIQSIFPHYSIAIITKKRKFQKVLTRLEATLKKEEEFVEK